MYFIRACVRVCKRTCVCVPLGKGEQRAVAAVSNRFLQLVSGEQGHTQSHYCSPTIFQLFCNLCSTSQQGKWKGQTRKKRKERQIEGETGSEGGKKRKRQKQVSVVESLTQQACI